MLSLLLLWSRQLDLSVHRLPRDCIRTWYPSLMNLGFFCWISWGFGFSLLRRCSICGQMLNPFWCTEEWVLQSLLLFSNILISLFLQGTYSTYYTALLTISCVIKCYQRWCVPLSDLAHANLSCMAQHVFLHLHTERRGFWRPVWTISPREPESVQYQYWNFVLQSWGNWDI